MDQETLGSFSQDERKRQEAIYELIQTEQTYLRDLQLIIEVFYGPLQNILSSADQKKVFSNVEDLLLCNTALLSDMEDRQRKSDCVIEIIGDVFLEHVSVVDI